MSAPICGVTSFAMIEPIAAPNANRNTGHCHSTSQPTDEQIGTVQQLGLHLSRSESRQHRVSAVARLLVLPPMLDMPGIFLDISPWRRGGPREEGLRPWQHCWTCA
jgi:hypothetical protein